MIGPGGWVGSQSDFTTNLKPNIDCFWVDLDNAVFTDAGHVQIETLPSQDHYQVSYHQRRGVHILESVGKKDAGFSAPASVLSTICEQWHIPISFMARILRPGSLPRFEYGIEKTPKPHKKPVAINIGFRWGTGHANYMIVFGRYYLPTSTMAICIASKDILDFKRPECEIPEFMFPSVRELVLQFKAILHEHPMNLIPVLLECCERFVDIKSQYCNRKCLGLLRAQKPLLTPHLVQRLNSWHVQPKDLGRKVDRLFKLHDDVTWALKNTQELLEIGKAYLRLAKEVKDLESIEEHAMPTHLVEDVIHRTQMHAELLRYLQSSLNMQFTHQYSHAAQEDAEATKIISYLTLIFLPSTFVCAVFSTTIFDFQNWKNRNQEKGVVSRGWWIFVLTCLILSFATIVLWRGLKMPHKFRIKRSGKPLTDTEKNVTEPKTTGEV